MRAAFLSLHLSLLFVSQIVVSFHMRLFIKSNNIILRTSKTLTMMNDVRRTPNKRDKVLKNILDSVDFKRKPDVPVSSVMEDPLIPMIESIVVAADQRKATYISAFRTSSVTEVTTFMVVIEGNSRPQNSAIALAVEDAVLMDFGQQSHKQGDAMSGWIVLDYGSVIVHIMTPQMRSFYKLEKRWKDAEVVNLTELAVGVRQSDIEKTDSRYEGQIDDGSDETTEKDDNDPFWK
jgi:ribosome-associated protein